MPWTDSGLVNHYLPSVDLVADPTAFDSSMIVAERDLYAKLIVFIPKATVDTWTIVLNTPDMVISWCTEMSAAYYLSVFESYHLQPEIIDNQAARIYDLVLKGIKSAKFGGSIIVDAAGDPVPVAGISVSTPRWRFIEYLPTHEGGEIDP